VTAEFAIVDIGYKSEGQVAISEFTSVKGEVGVKPGDTVQVFLESRENDTGMVVLSKEKADKMRIWDEISAAVKGDEIIKGTIVGRVKGGLQVDIGVKAFLPGSQVDIRPVRNLDQYLAKEFEFKVIKFNQKRGNIVLSRRVLLEKQREEQKKLTLLNLKEGAIMKGQVKNLTDYGAFIDLGGIDGLLHITDMSWGRVGHPSEMFNVGDEVKVVVLKFDPAQERVSLGLKQIQEDPWHRADEKYPVGTRVKGKIRNLTSYGAFIELEEGLDGMIHVSDMSWTRKINHPSEVLEKGQKVDAVVLEVDSGNKRISLGLKQASDDPWNTITTRYQIGQLVKGTVLKVATFGAFIQLEEGVDGLVHISQISDNHIEKVRDALDVGQEVEARVIKIDQVARRIGLSIKAKEMPEEEFTRHKEEMLEGLQPGENMVDLAGAFDEAFSGLEEWHPGENKR